jgi:phage terminase large subunit-like protein
MTKDLIKLYKELESRRKWRKIDWVFPDQGADDPTRADSSWSRHLYGRHLDFFSAGAKYRMRWLSAANRCTTPNTLIETVAGLVPASEAFFSTSSDVKSWDGESECVQKFYAGHFQGIQQGFRVSLTDGTWFECSSHHQVLSDEGWISLDQLMSLSSGWRLSQTIEDFEANCVEGANLYGQPLPIQLNIDQEQSPSQACVQKQNHFFWHEDEAEPVFQYIQKNLPDNHEISHDYYSSLLGLFEMFQSHCDNTRAESWNGQLHNDLLSLLESSRNLVYLEDLENDGSQMLMDSPEYHDVSYKFEQQLLKLQSNSQFQIEYIQNQSLIELYDDDQHKQIFLPLFSPKLIGGKRIHSIIPLGLQPMVDASVSITHNYKAAGVFHHNCGKTHGMAYELTLHLTGVYPDWWTGKRFDACNDWWVVGQSSQTVQQILQTELLGEIGEFGSGMIPRDLLDFETLPSASKAGVSVNGFKVKHASGGYSTVSFKSVEQGILAFTGTAKSIWIDEPVPLPIFTECLTRTMTGDNILVVTATPITGMTDAILNFCNGDFKYGPIDDHKIMLQITWDDVPHLSADAKAALLSSIPPYQREARSKGIPALGSGAVYPIAQSQYVCDPFEIPSHWRRIVGVDVGWRMTAAAWLVENPDTGECYITSEYLAGEQTPNQHAVNIQARGKSIPVAIDPASHGRSQADGQIIFDQLQDMGLDLYNAVNARESGLWTCLELMQSGRLKVFSTCVNLIKDISNMARNNKGAVIDSGSYHIADAFRYAVMTRDRAKVLKSNTDRKSGLAGTRSW